MILFHTTAYMFDLKRFRKEKRLTQLELSDMLGYKQGSISNIERGSFDISPEALDILIEKFGDSVRNYIKDEPVQISNNNIPIDAQQEIQHLRALLEEKERLITVLLKQGQNEICEIELDSVIDSYSDDSLNKINKFSGKINGRICTIWVKDRTGEIEVEQYLPKKTLVQNQDATCADVSGSDLSK